MKYFILGIQHYLAENGRLDNIFTDLYFEKFTECLDQVAMTFPPLTKETSLISTRVSEEHLWESRQLGAHSPYVLLSTLVFFNTKYFHLWTVDDHAKLKFASVVKVLKKGRGKSSTEVLKPGSSGGRSPSHSILRYTHPDSDEKVYEQHENLETPLRCPVKLYEFYLSRWQLHLLSFKISPEPVRRGGDLFYLLPERACVPDSPVWYSSIALGFDALGKIIHRIKMVKEICEAYVNDEIPS
ncbi:hypothetical protein J437_LFUL007909 [Ladona fulva]|uniref:DUF3504 domain-containing protein n=1 Tax=Ladona fulva TaxID=123851 RepID=A0A8K0K788_LADFU|nr:hypothetical protein J437_LFUL007909 [Ladona fulva]